MTEPDAYIAKEQLERAGKLLDERYKFVGTLTNWQPIETAPKDGTAVDLWLDSGERVADVRWGDPFPFGDPAETPSGAWLMSQSVKYLTEEDGQPTHWMPVPGPPR